MNSIEHSQRTTVNVQEKANLIWAIADKLVGTYKPHEYGLVVLPMCVIKRFNDTLLPHRDKVLKTYARLKEDKIQVVDGFLYEVSGYNFYNTSAFTMHSLLADPENIQANFRSYLAAFSPNVIDIIEKFDFDKEITKLSNNHILYNVIQEFCTKKADMSPDVVSSADMGYIFEELVRKFSESYNDQAGAHFTARDIIYLMTDLLISPHREAIAQGGVTTTVYDMAMGTSQMLGCMEERLKAIDPGIAVASFGQELNEQTFAIAKADMLIKGGNPNNMRHGNTLSNDQFPGFTFDYIISNPPFGIEWKNERAAVQKEHQKGEAGRFAPGLPAISDSQQLFVLNGLSKLRAEGRMAIIQNGSPLFSGDAGSGPSAIRGYLLENDWLEAIIQLPNDLFYNTGISTYIWMLSKNKHPQRASQVQLIDASKCFVKRAKSLGSKRNELDDRCIALILKAYEGNQDALLEEGDLSVESKVFDRHAFKYSKVTVLRPYRVAVKVNDETLAALKNHLESLGVYDEDDGVAQQDMFALLDGKALPREIKGNKTPAAVEGAQYLKTAMHILEDLKQQAPYYDKDAFIKLFDGHALSTHKMLKYKALEDSGLSSFLEERDEKGSIVLDKKGNPRVDTSLTDTETIPWGTDIARYMADNVLPYAPDAWVDESKTKIGYEIPFTRFFYRYVPPRPSAEIFARLKTLQAQEDALIRGWNP